MFCLSRATGQTHPNAMQLHHACQQGLGESLSTTGRNIRGPSLTVRPQLHHTASTTKLSHCKVPYALPTVTALP